MDHAKPSRLLRLRAAATCPAYGVICPRGCPGTAAARKTSVGARPHARRLDQFYTCPAVAKDLLHALAQYVRFRDYHFIEPSAGTGSFYLQLPNGSIGYDIEPKCPGVIEADFLSVAFPRNQRIVVVGNPPFGRNAASAIAFFNHAAFFAEYIAFIVPKTFRKISVQNRLNLDFHMVAEIPVPENAFVFEGRSKDVPTVFQIWKRQDTPRQKIKLPLTHPDFEFVRDRRQANVVVQRIGARAGRVHFDFSRSGNSHYFIRVKSSEVLQRLLSLHLAEAASCSAGCPSISKAELVYYYSQMEK